MGKGSRIESGVLLQISNGGRISIGDDVTIRRGAVLNVSGTLELHGRNLISWYTVVHCSDTVVLEEMAGAGESVTIVDSAHCQWTKEEPPSTGDTTAGRNRHSLVDRVDRRIDR